MFPTIFASDLEMKTKHLIHKTRFPSMTIMAAAAALTLFVGAAGNCWAQKSEGLAATPQMGWNSWNKFACEIDERLIRETADAMVCLLYTSPSPRDQRGSRMPSSA